LSKRAYRARKLEILVVELTTGPVADRQNVGSSHQQSQQARQSGAADEHQPVTRIETKNPAFGSHARDHVFLLIRIISVSS
jgi:hypothetical protein